MAAPLYIGKRKVKLRFILFIAVLLIGSAYIYKLIKPSHIYTSISYKEIMMIDSCPVVVIRDETVYKAPVYGKAILNISDGEMVNKDQSLAVLYKENFDEQATNQLHLLQEKILVYQQENLLDQILEDDLSKLNDELDKIINEIRKMVNAHNFAQVSKKETEIRSIVNRKNKLLDLRTEPDSYLSKLYTDEAALLGKIDEWVIDIKAPESGIISFSIDGYENILGIDSLDKLTTQDFTAFINNEVQSSDTEYTQAEQPFYKIINPQSKWYAVFEKPIKECYYKLGDNVNIKLHDKLIKAKVNSINREKEKLLIVLEFDTDIEKVINRRKTTINIEKKAEGLSIPENSLYEVDNSPGIYVLKNNKEEFVKVTVKAESNGVVIIEPVMEDQVQLHDSVRLAQ